MAGIGQNDIKLKELFQRLKDDVDEVIIATNSSVEVRLRQCILARWLNLWELKLQE